MVTAYGTVITAIKDALLANVKTTTSFSTHAYAHYIQRVTGNPTAFVRLKSDRIMDVGPYETQHLLTFSVQINFRGTYTEATLDSIIGYVGEVIDAIEADRNLSSAYVLNTEVSNVDYTYREAENAVFHYGYITVEIEALRNV